MPHLATLEKPDFFSLAPNHKAFEQPVTIPIGEPKHVAVQEPIDEPK